MVIKESSMVTAPIVATTSPAMVASTTTTIREDSPKHRSFKEKVKGIFHHHHHD
jgi:hypothetical protein